MPLLAALAVTACTAAPRRVALSPAPVFASRQQVEVWQAGKVLTLHAARVTAEELSGIPHWQPVDCDSCRVSVTLGTIDSLRAVHGERAAVLVTALPIAVLAAAMVTWGATEGD